MMDPREEAISLKNDPLPPQPISEEDRLLPTRIAATDVKIADYEVRIASLREERAILLDHAVKNGILEDARFRIEKKTEYGDRVPDPEKLKTKSPELFDQYLTTMKSRVELDFAEKKAKSVEKIGKVINVGVADTIFGKLVVTKCSTRKETISWGIVKK